MMKEIIKNNKYLFNLALSIKEAKLKQNVNNLNIQEVEYVEELRKNGVVAIPNFFSEAECRDMITSFEQLDEKYAKNYENDKRVYGVEHLSEIHKKLFYDNEMFKRVGEAYIGDELILQTTLASKIIPDETSKYGSGGGWHRDSFSKQFKAIAYLDDVSMNNGPFMYIKGSQTMKNIKKIIFELNGHKPCSNFRYTEKEIEEVKNLLKEEVTYFTAPKGTLLLADIRGLHTGMPIKDGHRYAVYNYYIAKSYHQNNDSIEQLAKNNLEKYKIKK